MQDNLVFLAAPATDQLVDLFAGCGGSGGGLLEANDILGRQVQGTFVNHWDKAIEIHAANHPEHRHLEEDLFKLDPSAVFPPETNCTLLWGSPQCTFFSVARGAACVNEQDRSHAHSITDWIRHLKPKGLLLENVPEWIRWGPVIQKRFKLEGSPFDGELMWALNAKPIYPVRDPKHPSRKVLPKEHRRQNGETEVQWAERMLALDYQRYEVPDPDRAGEYFESWKKDVEALGYELDHRVLCSADFGDPTIRKRLFVYGVRKGSDYKIVWPEPFAGDPAKPHSRPMNWRTARQIIDWSKKGTSVFSRPKALAPNTFRRLAIGLVKYGLKPYLVSSAHSSANAQECATRVHSLDEPVKTLTVRGERGLVVPTVTDAFIVPQHAGHQKDHVKSVDAPVSTVTCNHRGEGLALPAVEFLPQLRGTSTARSADAPVAALTAGGGHQGLAEAFMFAIDQSGGTRQNDGTYSVDSPMRTLVTKNNQACIEIELAELSDRFLDACKVKGVDTSRAETFLGYLMEALNKHGKLDAKPYIYVYYSNGSEGKDIDEPLPTVRCKAGHALVYPVIELNGRKLKIDLLYRMLMPLELQRAMGFPDDMEWPNCTTEQQVRAIGNSVSRGVSRALGLAFYAQDPDVWKRVKHIYAA